VTNSAIGAVSTIGDRSRKSTHPALLMRRALYKLDCELRRRRFDQRQLNRLLPQP
jgi:hypothetical protein